MTPEQLGLTKCEADVAQVAFTEALELRELRAVVEDLRPLRTVPLGSGTLTVPNDRPALIRANVARLLADGWAVAVLSDPHVAGALMAYRLGAFRNAHPADAPA